MRRYLLLQRRTKARARQKLRNYTERPFMMIIFIFSAALRRNEYQTLIHTLPVLYGEMQSRSLGRFT